MSDYEQKRLERIVDAQKARVAAAARLDHLRAKFATADPDDAAAEERELWSRERHELARLEAVARYDLDEGELNEHLRTDRTRRVARLLNDAEDSGAAVVVNGWEPVDVAGLLAGDLEPVRPTILPRNDGLCLLYPGLTHSFNGEPGSGKSWLAQWACVGVLKAGGWVLYIDYESNQTAVFMRLRYLGCTDEELLRVVYVRPETPPEGPGFDALLSRPYPLAVVDGVTAALNLSGLTGDALTNNNDALTRWHQMLPERIARETGAAVVQVDHVTKSKTTRGGYAIGGQAKKANVSGASYILVKRESFGRGRPGYFDVLLSKDREGFVAGAAGEDGSEGAPVCRVEVAAHESGDGRVQLDLVPVDAASDEEKEAQVRARVLAFLTNLPEDHDGTSKNAIRGGVKGNNEVIDAALGSLVRAGEACEVWVGKNGKELIHPKFRAVRPSEDFEPGGDDEN